MFLLLLMGLGAAGVKAQVRIGGNGQPHTAAVLDLNANDDATPAGNKGALALPRVSLASTTATLNGATPINGMLVYNTGGTLAAGIYYWNGSSWSAPVIYSGPGTMPVIAWTKSLDTIVTTPSYSALTFGKFFAPTVGEFDVCTSTGGWVITTGAGEILYLYVSNQPPASFRFVCFRPYL